MFSSNSVFSIFASRYNTQMSNNATSIGSSAGSVICQLPNNARPIGMASLSSISQISYTAIPAGQGETGPVGVVNNNNMIEVIGPTGPIFFITGLTGPSEPKSDKIEEKLPNNECCVKWYY